MAFEPTYGSESGVVNELDFESGLGRERGRHQNSSLNGELLQMNTQRINEMGSLRRFEINCTIPHHVSALSILIIHEYSQHIPEHLLFMCKTGNLYATNGVTGKKGK